MALSIGVGQSKDDFTEENFPHESTFIVRYRPDTAQLFLRSCWAFVKLEYLNLESNNLGCIPQEICLLTELKTLNLDSNKISDLSTDLSGLSHLQSLSIGHSYENEDWNVYETIPLWLLSLQGLTELNIGSNKIECIPRDLFVTRKGRASIAFPEFRVDINSCDQTQTEPLSCTYVTPDSYSPHFSTTFNCQIRRILFQELANSYRNPKAPNHVFSYPYTNQSTDGSEQVLFVVYKEGNRFLPCIAHRYADRTQKDSLSEVALLKSQRHPNVQDVYGLISFEHDYYIASEFGPTTLSTIIDTFTRLPSETVLSYMKMLLMGLSFIHDKPLDMVHGKINPFNIIYFPGGVKLKHSFASQTMRHTIDFDLNPIHQIPQDMLVRFSNSGEQNLVLQKSKKDDILDLSSIARYMSGMLDIYGKPEDTLVKNDNIANIDYEALPIKITELCERGYGACEIARQL